MTDNDIIKALECCGGSSAVDCYDCPLKQGEITHCTTELATNALSLINRQNAEIESLRNTVKTDFLTVTEKLKLSQSEIRDIRAEAVKEVTKKWKADLEYYLVNNEENGVVYIPKFVVEKRLKEMTEQTTNSD